MLRHTEQMRFKDDNDGMPVVTTSWVDDPMWAALGTEPMPSTPVTPPPPSEEAVHIRIAVNRAVAIQRAADKKLAAAIAAAVPDDEEWWDEPSDTPPGQTPDQPPDDDEARRAEANTITVPLSQREITAVAEGHCGSPC